MKKLVLVGLCAATVVTMAACGQSESATIESGSASIASVEKQKASTENKASSSLQHVNKAGVKPANQKNDSQKTVKKSADAGKKAKTVRKTVKKTITKKVNQDKEPAPTVTIHEDYHPVYVNTTNVQENTYADQSTYSFSEDVDVNVSGMESAELVVEEVEAPTETDLEETVQEDADTADEVQSGDVQGTLEDYYQTVLTEKYGVSDEQQITCPYEMQGDTSATWGNYDCSEGIIAHKIIDMDQDGSEELIVILREKGQATNGPWNEQWSTVAEVYGFAADEIVCFGSEQLETATINFDDYELRIFLKETDGTYELCCDSYGNSWYFYGEGEVSSFSAYKVSRGELKKVSGLDPEVGTSFEEEEIDQYMVELVNAGIIDIVGNDMSSFPHVAYEEGGCSDLVTVSGRTNYPESEYALNLSEDEIAAVEAGEYYIRGTVTKADFI